MGTEKKDNETEFLTKSRCSSTCELDRTLEGSEFSLTVEYRKGKMEEWDQRVIPHPGEQQGTDGFVVTGLHSHVTLVMLLPDVLSSPQDTVTPCRRATLFAARGEEGRKSWQNVLVKKGALAHPSNSTKTSLWGVFKKKNVQKN